MVLSVDCFTKFNKATGEYSSSTAVLTPLAKVVEKKPSTYE